MKENTHKIIGNIIIALIISAAAIFSCYIGVKGLADYKSKRNDIDIEGKSTQQITSDLIVWTGCFTVQDVDFKVGYERLEADKAKVMNYLVGKGLKEEDLVFSSVATNENYAISETGAYTNEIASYNLTQKVTISSSDVNEVTEISRNATELLNDGVQFQSYAPQYHYTKLADLKVTMLADATKDATKRAEMIAENAGNKLGDLTHAHVSSIKITPLYSDGFNSNDYYEYGGYITKDTSSLEKEVSVVVYCTFEIE